MSCFSLGMQSPVQDAIPAMLLPMWGSCRL